VDQHVDTVVADAVLNRWEQAELSLETEHVPGINHRAALDAAVYELFDFVDQFGGFDDVACFDGASARAEPTTDFAEDSCRGDRHDAGLGQAGVGEAHLGEVRIRCVPSMVDVGHGQSRVPEVPESFRIVVIERLSVFEVPVGRGDIVQDDLEGSATGIGTDEDACRDHIAQHDEPDVPDIVQILGCMVRVEVADDS